MSQLWVVYWNVPLVDEFEKKSPDQPGYTADELAQIVVNSNKRAEDTGDLAPISLGHTSKKNDQTEQPEIVGFVSGYYLSTFGELEPRPCIYAKRFAFFKDKFEKYDIERNFPRRSCEVWRPDLYIDPVAVLGPTSPCRDLGLLGDFEKTIQSDLDIEKKYVEQFAKKHQGDSKYTEEANVDLNKEETIKEMFQYFLQSAEGQFVQKLMKDCTKAEAEEDDEEDNKKHSKPEEEDDDAKDKDRLQKDELKKQVAQYSKELETYKTQIDALQRESRRAKRERDLVRLEQNEGVLFDLPEELDEIQDLPDDKYEKYKTRMVARYAKAPVGVNIPLYKKASDLPKSNPSSADIDKATQIAMSEKISVFEALKKVGG